MRECAEYGRRLLSAAMVVTIGWSTLNAAQEPSVNQLAARVDPYTERQRVVVMTDIANEPDDQMSMVRFLVYANRFDVEGLIATTSTWMKNKVRPDVIRTLVDAYAQVRPNLLKHQAGLPDRRRRFGTLSSRASRHTGWPAWVRARCRPGPS